MPLTSARATLGVGGFAGATAPRPGGAPRYRNHGAPTSAPSSPRGTSRTWLTTRPPAAVSLPHLRGCRLVAALRFPEVRQSTKHEVDGTLALACAASATPYVRPFASSRIRSAPRQAQIRRAPPSTWVRSLTACPLTPQTRAREGRTVPVPLRWPSPSLRSAGPTTTTARKFSGDGGFAGATTAELNFSRRLDYGGTATSRSQDGETATPSTRPPSRVATPFGERRGVLRTPL